MRLPGRFGLGPTWHSLFILQKREWHDVRASSHSRDLVADLTDRRGGLGCRHSEGSRPGGHVGAQGRALSLSL